MLEKASIKQQLPYLRKSFVIIIFCLTQVVTANGAITTVYKEVNGLIFKCRVAGVPTNEPVILLHGWPSTSYQWIELMNKLEADGYYCIAPDLRGFSVGARPRKVKNYAADLVVSDIIKLADSFGLNKFHLVCHDIGAIVGWYVLNVHADRVKSFTSLSVPHIRGFSEAVRFDKEQRKMSWYIRAFQWRGFPEWYLLKKNQFHLRELWENVIGEQLKEYLEVMGNKSGLKSTINLYRANFKLLKRENEMEKFGDVHTPTLIIWGNKDIAVARKGFDLTQQYMKGPYRFIELDSGHDIIKTDFEICSEAIFKHLQEYR